MTPFVSDHQLKVPVVRRHEYTLYLEQAAPHLTFIHCTMRVRWSATVKKAFLRDLDVLKDLHGGPIYALHEPGDEKHLKFLGMCGFTYVTNYSDRITGELTEIHRAL